MSPRLLDARCAAQSAPDFSFALLNVKVARPMAPLDRPYPTPYHDRLPLRSGPLFRSQ